MPTITKTKRYRELTYRHLKLLQLYSVVSELRLHTNKAIDKKVAQYYNNKLYTWDDFSPFFTASTEAMLQVFYIELDGFVGAFWDTHNSRIRLRKNEQGSLAAFLYDSTRTDRKKSATKLFESLLKCKANELGLVNDVRGKLAHFKKLDMRNAALVPGDKETREILDELSKVIHLLGFQRWNEPHFIGRDNDASASTRTVIDRVVQSDEDSTSYRQAYIAGRKKWFS